MSDDFSLPTFRTRAGMRLTQDDDGQWCAAIEVFDGVTFLSEFKYSSAEEADAAIRGWIRRAKEIE